MQKTWIAVLAGLPLIIGAGPPPDMRALSPPAKVVNVNFLERLLQGNGGQKNTSSSSRRASRAKGRNAAPRPPALARVPLPIPRPSGDAENQPVNQAQAPAPEHTDAAPVAPQTKPGSPANTTEPEAPKPDTQPSTAGNPQQPPVVEQPGTATEPPSMSEVPKPQPKPEDAPATSKTGNEADDGAKSAEPGKPPEDNDKTADEQKKEQAEAPPPPPPLVEENPEELKACLVDLAAIGAKFKPVDPIDDGNGCGIRQPIEVAEVLPGIELGGAAMRCKTALTLAHWLKDTVQPAMNIAMPGRRVTGLVPGSTYACRLRNGASTGKISEHARGNAFDVAAFKLDNGKTMEMKPRDEDSTLEGAFQRTATAGACLHFTTVLSPGSDAAHETHLHLDIMERKNGYRYCR